MILTEDDVYAINQALRHCYKQDAQIYAQGTTKMVAWNELWDKFDGEQILTNQENAEKLKRIEESGGKLMDKYCYKTAKSDREIVERLKKRIEEIKKLLENTKLTKDESMELQYWLRENTMALGDDKSYAQIRADFNVSRKGLGEKNEKSSA